jgi:hypothetical protein
MRSLFASAALLLTASITTQADEPSHIPATVQSKANAAVIAKADRALRTSVSGLSNVWIFATGDANSVFVSYTTDTGHLALVEMQDDRIATLRDLNSTTDALLAAATH